MAAVYMEGETKVTVDGSAFENNYVIFSVWAGFGEERVQKIPRGALEFSEEDSEEDKKKDDIDVPFSEESSSEWSANDLTVPGICSLESRDNHFSRGILWAGKQRPSHLVEENNVFGEALQLPEPGYAEKLWFLDWDDAKLNNVSRWENHCENTPGQGGGLTMPDWAPKDRIGGDGYCQWGPLFYGGSLPGQHRGWADRHEPPDEEASDFDQDDPFGRLNFAKK
mmetsp:Transcript_28302/g.65881  ORF Transcript_28302/g.65881 Transcript_28302/m.65881 type:complete len:224 (-) Transcript_28302:140-811(-)